MGKQDKIAETQKGPGGGKELFDLKNLDKSKYDYVTAQQFNREKMIKNAQAGPGGEDVFWNMNALPINVDPSAARTFNNEKAKEVRAEEEKAETNRVARLKMEEEEFKKEMKELLKKELFGVTKSHHAYLKQTAGSALLGHDDGYKAADDEGDRRVQMDKNVSKLVDAIGLYGVKGLFTFDATDEAEWDNLAHMGFSVKAELQKLVRIWKGQRDIGRNLMNGMVWTITRGTRIGVNTRCSSEAANRIAEKVAVTLKLKRESGPPDEFETSLTRLQNSFPLHHICAFAKQHLKLSEISITSLADLPVYSLFPGLAAIWPLSKKNEYALNRKAFNANLTAEIKKFNLPKKAEIPVKLLDGAVDRSLSDKFLGRLAPEDLVSLGFYNDNGVAVKYAEYVCPNDIEETLNRLVLVVYGGSGKLALQEARTRLAHSQVPAVKAIKVKKSKDEGEGPKRDDGGEFRDGDLGEDEEESDFDLMTQPRRSSSHRRRSSSAGSMTGGESGEARRERKTSTSVFEDSTFGTSEFPDPYKTLSSEEAAKLSRIENIVLSDNEDDDGETETKTAQSITEKPEEAQSASPSEVGATPPVGGNNTGAAATPVTTTTSTSLAVKKIDEEKEENGPSS